MTDRQVATTAAVPCVVPRVTPLSPAPPWVLAVKPSLVHINTDTHIPLIPGTLSVLKCPMLGFWHTYTLTCTHMQPCRVVSLCGDNNKHHLCRRPSNFPGLYCTLHVYHGMENNPLWAVYKSCFWKSSHLNDSKATKANHTPIIVRSPSIV